MDETPEELEQIRREADAIDVYRYRKRFRFLAAIGLGALMAGLVWLVLVMVDSKRDPCERVRAHFCAQDPQGLQCKSYTNILDGESNADARQHQGAVPVEDRAPQGRRQHRRQVARRARRPARALTRRRSCPG